MALTKHLVRECFGGGPNARAATYFAWLVGDLRDHVMDARRLPESNKARAFGVVRAAFQRARDDLRKLGLEPELGSDAIQAAAELVAEHVLRGEGISVTDVLVAINDYTATIPLAEWIADAPPIH
jgi:hypothetical protein